MKTKVLILLALGLGPVLAACGSADGRAAGSFLALTYNVAGLPEGLSSSQPELFIPQISPLLNEYDLVLVQEDFAYHEALAAEAEHPYQSEPKVAERPMNDGLNRFSQTPFFDLERHTWEACNGITDSASDCLADKGFSVASHELAAGVFLDVYNLHLDAGGGEGDIQARSDQVDQLLAEMAVRSAGRAVLVAGDTNLKPDQRPADRVSFERLLAGAELADACRSLDCGDERIDRFLFRSADGLTLRLSDWRVEERFVDAQGQDLSDHKAVAVTVSWRE